VHYMSTLLHASFKRFQIAPHEQQKAIDLTKSEILKRQSELGVGRNGNSSSSNNNTTASSSSSSSTNSKYEQSTNTQNILSECFDLPVADQDSEADLPYDHELTSYLALNEAIGPKDDVLLF
ncbi:unnamed protein product, partial [Adineta ricciae]